VILVRAQGHDPLYHHAAITRALAQVEDGSGVLPDAGRSFSRVKRRAEVQAAA
jgi:hypothetical protein